jgi:hypothetical protein
MTDIPKVYGISESDLEKFNKIFTYHPLKEGQAEKYIELRSSAKAFAQCVLHLCPWDDATMGSKVQSREKQNALDCISEAVMWANASIARNEI